MHPLYVHMKFFKNYYIHLNYLDIIDESSILDLEFIELFLGMTMGRIWVGFHILYPYPHLLYPSPSPSPSPSPLNIKFHLHLYNCWSIGYTYPIQISSYHI